MFPIWLVVRPSSILLQHMHWWTGKDPGVSGCVTQQHVTAAGSLVAGISP